MCFFAPFTSETANHNFHLKSLVCVGSCRLHEKCMDFFGVSNDLRILCVGLIRTCEYMCFP